MKKHILLGTLTILSISRSNGNTNQVADPSISELIASNFLQARKKSIEDYSCSTFHNDTVEKKIFDIKWDVNIYDVEMKIKREGTGDSSTVILETSVKGAPEDFEGKNVLESERKLFKHVLIKNYLEKLNEQKTDSSKKPIVVQIDNNTKSIMPPTPMVRVTEQFFQKSVTECQDRKSMSFMTVFSAPEFDILVKKYFSEDVNKQEKKSGWFW